MQLTVRITEKDELPDEGSSSQDKTLIFDDLAADLDIDELGTLCKEQHGVNVRKFFSADEDGEMRVWLGYCEIQELVDAGLKEIYALKENDTTANDLNKQFDFASLMQAMQGGPTGGMQPSVAPNPAGGEDELEKMFAQKAGITEDEAVGSTTAKSTSASSSQDFAGAPGAVPSKDALSQESIDRMNAMGETVRNFMTAQMGCGGAPPPCGMPGMPMPGLPPMPGMGGDPGQPNPMLEMMSKMMSGGMMGGASGTGAEGASGPDGQPGGQPMDLKSKLAGMMNVMQQNPDLLKQIVNTPVIQNMVKDPEKIKQVLERNSAFTDKKVAAMMNDPEKLKKMQQTIQERLGGN